MPSSLVDTSQFPIGRDIDYESKAEVERLAALEDRARHFIQSHRWAPPIAKLILAFGVAPIAALFLVRFQHNIEGNGDTELWVMVGDLPSAYFVVEAWPRPAEALEAYCELMEDWADGVVAGADLSELYPVPVEPTVEHAHMLRDRIEFIRTKLIPLA